MTKDETKIMWLTLENTYPGSFYYPVSDALRLINELQTSGYDKERYIFFYVDNPNKIYMLNTYKDTQEAIRSSQSVIHTSDLSHMSLELIRYGFRIFISDGIYCFNMRMHHPGIVKDIRYTHDVRRILCAGGFNYMLPGLPDIFCPGETEMKPVYDEQDLFNASDYI